MGKINVQVDVFVPEKTVGCFSCGPPLAFSLVMHVNYNLVSPSDKKEEYE